MRVFNYLFGILPSARRLKLRDKGNIEPCYRDGQWIVHCHATCMTTTRIGINKAGEAIKYCWRCEVVFDKRALEPQDKTKEPVMPACEGNVVIFKPPEKAS